mgnify:CR=1 FL=1
MWFLLALGCWLCLCWLLGQRTPAGANAVFSPVERIDPDKATLDEEHRFANVFSMMSAADRRRIAARYGGDLAVACEDRYRDEVRWD